MIADQWVPLMTGVDFLLRAHQLHPAVRRAVLFDAFADCCANEPILHAMALGRIDTWLVKPWEPADHHLHLRVSELLDEWVQLTEQPGLTTMRIVAEPWAPRTHELRDFLDSSDIPVVFASPESPQGLALLTQSGQDGARLPVVVYFDGRAQLDPSNPEIAQAVAVRTRPDTDSYDITVVGAGPVGELLGAGVFYGAAVSEARATCGQPVYIAGAGNSAGQAAIHLAKYAEHVTILARGHSLSATMSDYLIKQIDATPTIAVGLNTQVISAAGAGHLEYLTLHDAGTENTRTVEASALFVLIGAQPNTDWLAGAVARDSRGFLATCATDRRSGWHLRSAKARTRSSSPTSTSTRSDVPPKPTAWPAIVRAQRGQWTGSGTASRTPRSRHAGIHPRPKPRSGATQNAN